MDDSKKMLNLKKIPATENLGHCEKINPMKNSCRRGEETQAKGTEKNIFEWVL